MCTSNPHWKSLINTPPPPSSHTHELDLHSWLSFDLPPSKVWTHDDVYVQAACLAMHAKSRREKRRKEKNEWDGERDSVTGPKPIQTEGKGLTIRAWSTSCGWSVHLGGFGRHFQCSNQSVGGGGIYRVSISGDDVFPLLKVSLCNWGRDIFNEAYFSDERGEDISGVTPSAGTRSISSPMFPPSNHPSCKTQWVALIRSSGGGVM